MPNAQPSPAPAPLAPSPTLVAGFELASTGGDVRDPEALGRQAGLDWVPALVPGGVHESLVAAGRIGHPYAGANEREVRWVEDATWWYRTRFDAPAGALPLAEDQRARLTFPGLDTVVRAWLNGQELGGHASQFRPATFDVTGRLRPTNDLVLRFAPPLEGLTAPPSVVDTVARVKALLGAADRPEGDPPPGVMSANLALTLRRKATFSWGWDFAPRLPSVGVARPGELRIESGAALAGHHVRATAVDAGRRTARVAVDVEADAFAHAGPLAARVTLTSPAGERTERVLDLAGGGGPRRTASVAVDLDRAELWWSHDLGPQPLYDVAVDLVAGGTVVDRVTDRVGLRTLTLDRSDDDVEGGRLFRFVLNGVPLFARGANWVPPDMMLGSVTAEACRALVGKARDANMTMLRVWGGGAYEQDAFYEACDEAGVLVWQDFMFACVDYPSDDPTLRAEVAAEADHQVRRLRNHAALALWCGNNEVHAIHGLAHRRDVGPGGWGYGFFHEVLPDAVARLDPGTPYWPGSPWADADPRGVNGVLDGDRHAWEVWHGVDVGAGGPTEFASRGEAVHFHRYAHDRGKFVSEFGIHASPEAATLRRWAGGPVTLDGPELGHRNKDVPKRKGDDLMAVETGLPRDLAEYVDFSMAAQAEGLKFGIEHYRRRQPHTSGTLIWQFNDPWPGLSWSIVDYDGVAKAGYYYAQRAYRPVLASFARTGDGGLELWVTNSLPTAVALDLVVEVATFDGRQVLAEQVSVEAAGLGSGPVWSAPAAAVGPGPDRYAWVSDASGSSGVVAPNRLFFAPVKDLGFDGHVEPQVTAGPGGTAIVDLVSHGYSYLARVTAPAPGVSFSANYLDLRDGQHHRIEVSNLPADFDPHTLSATTFARP